MAKKASTFKTKLKNIQIKHNSLVCVGLDSNLDLIPEKFKKQKFPQFEFNKWIIDQTAESVCAFKPNLAFYEARGSKGWLELEKTMGYLHQNYPEIVTIADAKRADIGSTNDGYVTAIFDHLGFDAVTLHPYLGREALDPFLKRKDKGCIILCRTSNPGAGEIQDTKMKVFRRSDSAQTARIAQDDSGSMNSSLTLWQIIAEKVNNEWNKNDNCLLVVGATYPEELKIVRQIVGEMDLLVPGIGSQGGDLESIMDVGLNSQKRGMIINSSRGIIFSENPARESLKLRDQINKLL